MNRGPRCPPLIDRPLEVKTLGCLDCAIECHPGHHFRMDEMTSRSSHFPDAFVRFRPGTAQKRHQSELEIPRLLVDGNTAPAPEMERVDQLTIDIKLELMHRPIADAHRFRASESRQPLELELRQPPLTGNPVR